MARPKKQVTEKNKVLGEEMRIAFNTDEWHKLFDILVTYEEEGGFADDEVGRLIQKYIEKKFADHNLPWLSEADFVLKKISAIVGSWVFKGKPIPAMDINKKKTVVIAKGLLTRQDFEDVVSNTFMKMMVAGTYNRTASTGEKVSYISKVAHSATMDRLRSMKNFKEQLVPDAKVLDRKKAS